MLKRFENAFFNVLFTVFLAIALFGLYAASQRGVAIADELTRVAVTPDDVTPSCQAEELDCTFILVTYNQTMTRFACQSATGQLDKRLVGTLDAIVLQYKRHDNGDLKEIHFLLYDENMDQSQFSVLTPRTTAVQKDQ